MLLLRGEGVEAVTAWDRTALLEQLRRQLSPADQELLLAGVRRTAGEGARYVPDYAQEPDAIAALVEAGLRSVAWIPVATLRGTQYLFVITRFGGLRGWPPRDQALIGAAARTVRVAFERQESLRQLEQVALTDPLTGLGNRRAMDRALHAWTTAADHAFAVLMMDLDGLKEVNDALGHDWGDRLLREFGHELRARVRSDDLVFRPSGDEFVVLLPEVQPAQTPEILAWVQDAAARVRRHPELRACGASAGLAFSHESQSPSVLLNLADERMYHDKRDRKPKRT
ncbi:GGDEF domain-containing protein [Deinococcus radiotolerans]|uniref:GGDEF domain-containing protein n=1 Tax=Deinococcus radiotolerans TaxID=1309407 RepID=A0ABQ2FPD5_9DEIO|nr:GGDEF domain-containing protein [Deinococcus radiotolerans]GGL13811.1 hypothetical protein GCM10010844_35830 [Deinococcus radiotolerans]